MTDDAYPDALPQQYRLHWYVLEGVLGQGGFGITYLARDTNLGRQVAIKEYLPAEVAQRRTDASVRPRTEAQGERYRWGLERFIGEAQTLARFDHPNIVRVLAVFEANDTAYMVMRFEEGDNLAQMLERRGTLPEAELLQILLPVLDGLQLVHAARFIHRDIKPENIHIRRDGSPVLLDFGSARQSLNRTHSMTVLVARGFAPLEQYYGDPDSQGAWTDIYSLAATCYRAIAGKAPADALERVKGVLGSVREVLTPALEIGRGRYSERLLKAIDHALELSEKDRPQSIDAWRQELAGAAAGAPGPGAQPADSPAPPADSPKTKAPGRSPRARLRRAQILWATGGAAGAAMVIAIFAGMQYQQNQGRQQESQQQELQRQQALQAQQERLEEQKRQREEEARSRDEDRARREAEERQRLLAQQEVQQRQVQARPPPRPRKDEGGKLAVMKSAVPEMKAPPAAPTPPKAEAAPPPTPEPAKAESARAPPEREAAAKPPPVESARKPTAAELLGQAEAALARSDYAGALPVIKRLASVGDARGQALLGRLYENGLGMPRNSFAAYMWYSLAARGGNAAAAGMKDRVAGTLQPAEIRQAEHAVANWRPRDEGVAAGTR